MQNRHELDTIKLRHISDVMTAGITGALQGELAQTKMSMPEILIGMSDSFARVTLGTMGMSGTPPDKAAVDALLSGLRLMLYERIGEPADAQRDNS